MNRLLAFSLTAAVAAACSATGSSNTSPRGGSAGSGGAGGGAGNGGAAGLAGFGAAGSDGGSIAPTIVIGPGADASAPGKFGGADDPSAKPVFVYPASGIVVPPNMSSLEIHWTPASGQTLFELTFEAPSATLIVYTGCQPLAGGCVYTPDQSFWTGLVSHAKGTPPVRYHLRGVNGASPGAIGSSDEQTIAFTTQDLIGGLYYWNAGSGVIQRADFGIPGAPVELYMNSVSAGAGVCVGCHVLSRDGKEMSVGKDMPAPAPYTVFDVATKVPLMAGGQPLVGAANFLSFSPDGKQLLASDSITIARRDVATGAVLDPTIVPLGTMPDWSPDGTAVAFAQPAAPPPFNLPQPGVDGAAIAVAPFDGAKFGAPSVLVPFAGQNNYYPAYAPDSKFVVFNRSPSNANSYDTADGQLWAVAASGGPAFQLANATAGAACSWPKWAPDTMTYYGGTLFFLTFSSRRSYGLHGGGTSQIWMAAFDVAKGTSGVDASTPAFWLPAQNLGTGNHIAQWVTKVERKPCKADADCDGGLVCRNDVCVPNVK